jgi:hypothetical protein
MSPQRSNDTQQTPNQRIHAAARRLAAPVACAESSIHSAAAYHAVA